MADKLVVSAVEAARLLNKDKGEVLKDLREGKIPGYRDGKYWKIPITLLQSYVENKAILETKERRTVAEEIAKEGDNNDCNF